MNRLLVTICLVFMLFDINATPVPQYSKDKHMGVATCASGVCHGKSAPDSSSHVLLNEYRVWLSEDDHSGAYKTLLSPQSKAIAKKLGLTSAHTAKVCLDCHADNIPKEKRGRRFQLSDGIGCEACHGGSERWLSDHSEEDATHESNIKLGLYPSEKPRDRAKLCLSCHLGTKQKFATHNIMGAGHPRLSFELESFTFNQPAHYKVDADYEKRKGSISSVNMMLTGLLFKANQQLELLQSERFKQHGIFPELAFYECHSCHHPMAISRMPVEILNSDMPSGAVRLDDAALVVISSILKALNTNNELEKLIKKLHNSSLESVISIKSTAKELQNQLNSISNKVIDNNYSKQSKQKMRKQLLEDTVKGSFRDFSSAEQVFLAVETLSIDLKDNIKFQKYLDAWFESVKDEDSFIPNQFIVMAKQFNRGLE